MKKNIGPLPKKFRQAKKSKIYNTMEFSIPLLKKQIFLKPIFIFLNYLSYAKDTRVITSILRLFVSKCNRQTFIL